MGGVGHFDQLQERYEIGRRSRKWWHRILYFLIDLAIGNAFILWKVSRKNLGPQDQLYFRLRLARQLISGFSSRERKGRPASFLSSKKTVPDDVPLTKLGDHMPTVQKHVDVAVCSLLKDMRREQDTFVQLAISHYVLILVF